MKPMARQAAVRGSTRTRRGLFAIACLGALGLTAFLGTGAPKAGAAEGECPNEAIRVEQGSTHLPDCRAYEMVSLADKNQGPLYHGISIATDGNTVAYRTIGGVEGSSTGSGPRMLATRGPSGWVSRQTMPPASELVAPRYLDGPTTPDLSAWLATAVEGFGSDATSSDAKLVRLDGDGAQTVLHHFPVYAGFFSGVAMVASDDLSHVIAFVPARADPSLFPTDDPNNGNVYDFGAGTPQLVSAMPDTGLPPFCGVAEGVGFAGSPDSMASHYWASGDGTRAFFITRGDSCADPLELYMRDLVAGTTTLVSGPPLAGDADLGVNYFLQATPSGSEVFFRTATSLDPKDDADGNTTDQDIYRWTATAAQNTCLTCVEVAGAPVSAKVLPGRLRAAVSVDGTHVYFLSTAKLGDAPAAGTAAAPNLYVWRSSGVHFITRTGLGNISSDPRQANDLTPDGNAFVFPSRSPFINASVTDGSNNGGTDQFYRYDDRDGTLTCISCPLGRPATIPVPLELAESNRTIIPDVHSITDDGNTVFFPTDEALVGADVNQGPDLYEWSHGTVSLITTGRIDYGRVGFQVPPKYLGASADGRDVFILEFAKLTADAEDSAPKVYDVRVGGGFAQPLPPLAPCQGEVCLGPSATQPGTLNPSTSVIAGAGNVVAKHRRKHRAKHRKHRPAKRSKARANTDRRAHR